MSPRFPGHIFEPPASSPPLPRGQPTARTMFCFLGFLSAKTSSKNAFPAAFAAAARVAMFHGNSATFEAGDGSRTHVSSLEGYGSTVELHPRVFAAKHFFAGRSLAMQLFRVSECKLAG